MTKEIVYLDRLLVIIPAFNEQGAIRQVVQSVEEKKASRDFLASQQNKANEAHQPGGQR